MTFPILKYLPLHILLFIIPLIGCAQDKNREKTKNIEVGAQQMDMLLPLLQNRKVAVVANQASLINSTHLVDSLISLNVDVVKIFSPEHGFRGIEDAGAKVDDEIDSKTGLKIHSLHGKHKKPTKESLSNVETIVFDLQDVGVRFYTYISSLHYVMEAAAENKINLIILDRPNPNAFYIDGPILEPEYKSFIGMHPVPIVYGMTIGEYGQMINGEYWLKDSIQCNLQVIPCRNYNHQSFYSLPIKPSPNLPNDTAIALYPSLCFFEGTKISVGRGTEYPFQIFGYPQENLGNFSFTPKPNIGAKHPKLEGETCFGKHLNKESINYLNRVEKQLNLSWLIDVYNKYENKAEFFRKDDFFNLLAGNKKLKEDIINQKTEEEIKASWKEDLDHFKTIRVKYLIYP